MIIANWLVGSISTIEVRLSEHLLSCILNVEYKIIMWTRLMDLLLWMHNLVGIGLKARFVKQELHIIYQYGVNPNICKISNLIFLGGKRNPFGVRRKTVIKTRL